MVGCLGAFAFVLFAAGFLGGLPIGPFGFAGNAGFLCLFLMIRDIGSFATFLTAGGCGVDLAVSSVDFFMFYCRMCRRARNSRIMAYRLRGRM